MEKYSKEIMDLLNSVNAKRPKTVIQHILKFGFITTKELKELYGYDHPPRAARDVRELGIPLETFKKENKEGKIISAYQFGNFSSVKNILSKKSGRTILSKLLKNALIEKYGSKCFIYMEYMDESQLQVDHRIPYEIAGEQNISKGQKERNIDDFMLLSPSANRAKSWICEHCNNWDKKDKNFCLKCFWAYPEEYEHIAGKFEKTVQLIFTGNEIDDYNKLIEIAGGKTLQETIKDILRKYIKNMHNFILNL